MSAKARFGYASILALACATAVPAAAQTPPGQSVTRTQGAGGITGVVTDDTGTERLEGAIIRIEELGRETATDSEGRFGFADVPDGTYTVTAIYFGGDPFSGTVTVSGGQAPELSLAPAAGEIVVFGVRGNISASRSRERSSDVLQSVISSDAAGEFGDQNLAESLQRAPGISILRSEGEGTQVSIRGLSPQFTKITVDGVQLGASGNDGRGSSLDIISSDLASAITVNKYQLPDQPADAIGGTVNIEGLSAFDQDGFTLNVRAEGSYQEEADAVSPIVSANSTFVTGNLGISLAANYSRRRLDIDTLEGDQPPYLYQDRAGDRGYVPDKIIVGREIATRERFGFSGGLEFRPSDQDKMFLRGTYAQDNDLDLAMLQEWDIDNSQGGTNGVIVEVPDIDGDNFILADADALVEMSYQPETDRLYTITLGGEHTRGDWVLDYQGYLSHRKQEDDGSIKGEWREQNVLVAGSTTPDGYEIRQISLAEIQAITGLPTNQLPTSSGLSDGRIENPFNFEQIQVQTEESLREDTVWSFQANLRRNFVTGAGRDGYLKAGVSYLDRSQMRDRDRRNYNPTNAVDRQRICGSTSTSNPCVIAIGSRLSQFDLGIPQNSNLTLPFPSFAQVVPLFQNQADQYLDLATFGTSRDEVLTTSDDYDARETILAGYAMGQIGLTDNITVTGGVRVEHTKFRSNGYLTINNEGQVLSGDPAALVFTAELPEAEKSYTDFFPSLLVRFEPTRDIVVRAAYSTSTQRASFNQTRNSIVSEDDFATDDAGTPNDVTDDIFSSDLTLLIGRPDLDPYFAHNFDLSVAFYPTSSTVFSVAAFYKQIRDFIVPSEFTNVTLAELGFTNLPSVGQFTFDPNATYSTIETFINGDSATVKGVEFDFAHTFSWLPGPLENIFIQGNATIVESESRIEILRGDDVLPLVGQADLVANLSVGYEDDTFTARVSGNYSGERLAEIGSSIPLAQQLDPNSELDRYGDTYIEEYMSIDASLRVRLNRNIQLSLDAINLNNESNDINYKRSNRDYFETREMYGRTFKAGIRVSF